MDETRQNDEILGSLLDRAAADEIEAMYLLGIAYGSGTLVPVELKEAASWFRRAIAHNHAAAKTSMAYLYASGQGVGRNRQAAYILLREAIGEGDQAAKPVLMKLKQRMDAEDIDRAERRYVTRQRLRAIDRGGECPNTLETPRRDRADTVIVIDDAMPLCLDNSRQSSGHVAG